ncbi:hypothetical protein SETIT_8G039400v2 [Setaria italica]|uniref:NB-ARC domain-containing protein n=2 Tax=Setaria italica TaxID=4555 RepID=A0A368S3Z0_SETIT|nr:disease resistance protein RPM1 [Setaria italica]RCV37139.1 hypothetical protein SETIT_8G039400v2 [Setaria italica]
MLDLQAKRMEAALLGGLIRAVVPKLLSLADEKYKLQKGVKRGIKFLDKELRMIIGSIDDELSEQADDHGAVSGLLIEDLRELAFGIEDFLDSVRYHAIWKQQPASFRKIVRLPKKMLASLQFAGEVQRLKKLAMEVYERKKRYTGHAQQQPSAAAWMDESSSPVFDPRNICDTDLVGIDGLRADLLEQLSEAKGQLKVIAIVGFCGLGKTALTAQVYNREIGDRRFEKHAWVCAAGKQPTEVLTQVLGELNADSAGSSQGTSKDRQLCEDIRKQLHNKRYLIVIDDIQTEVLWRNIKSAFPDDNDVSSRVVVTTTIQSIANACSSSESYVHKMRRLDEECSKQLFSFKACPNEYSCYKQPDSAAILKKCGGQPLALVTIGEFLQTQGWPKGPSCEDICSKLHYHLKNDRTFEAMRRVLIRNYTSLPNHALKACLLYFGMFPCDYQIKRKSLLRLWLAEGFVELQPSTSTPDPATAFDALKDRNIIEPIYVSNNETVKTCQTYGMMHEFITHMSISQKFVTLLCDEMNNDKYVRRLSVHKSTATDGNNSDCNSLSLVRSLTVFGKPSEAILDFSKYRLLRVLDLEKCDDLKDTHVKNICSLLLLKYLSLGKNITKLPKDISKLTVLETLDLRQSMVAEVRAEVFLMPCLLHLFGKFMVLDAVDFPSQGRSVLQTLAGLITDGRQGYFNFMDYMTKLRKVKVWCVSSAGASGNWTDLQKAIQKFIHDKNVANIGDRSLSLHFDKSFIDSLNSLKEPCYLSSLKLHGELDALPQFVISLRGLKELCLTSVKCTKGLLEALTLLSNLKYLKLIADDLEKFTIKDKAFPSLLCLCFVLQHPTHPTLPTIQEGSMPFLNTLQLLCKGLHGLCGIKIEYLKVLKEVILDDRVDSDTWGEWEEAAKEHPNKPKVLPSKIADTSKREPKAEISKRKPTEDSDVLVPTRIKFTENSVASVGSVQDTGSSRIVNQGYSVASMGSTQDTGSSMLVNQGLDSSAQPKIHNIRAVQASSDGGSYSSSNHMGVFEVPPMTNLSETASKAESEHAGNCVPVELTKVDSANNSVSPNETIEQTDTPIPVNQKLGSSYGPNSQNSFADIQNHAFKSMEVSEDSVSTELSITGHGMVPSHTLQGC